MPQNKPGNYEHPLWASRNFIRPQYLPEAAEIRHKTMAYPSSYENYHGITMIYVLDLSLIHIYMCIRDRQYTS